jgi:small-conductance mechanosensitive channel
VFEAIMIEDTKILAKPAPKVYVLDLTPDGVLVSAPGWVDNSVYWVTKCELTEKTKFRFDLENILFAYPQLEIHYAGSRDPEC